MHIIEAVVLRALAKDPDERYGGCQELAADLYGLEGFAPERRAPMTLDDKRSLCPSFLLLLEKISDIFLPFSSCWVGINYILKVTPLMLKVTPLTKVTPLDEKPIWFSGSHASEDN